MNQQDDKIKLQPEVHKQWLNSDITQIIIKFLESCLAEVNNNLLIQTIYVEEIEPHKLYGLRAALKEIEGMLDLIKNKSRIEELLNDAIKKEEEAEDE